MKIERKVDFEFSGCTYHPKEPDGMVFGTEEAATFLREAGIKTPTRYQSYLFRDLLLQIGREIAEEFDDIEDLVRADVKKRLGYEEWVPSLVPNTKNAEVA